MLRHLLSWFLLLQISSSFLTIYAVPQDRNVEDLVNDFFSTNPTSSNAQPPVVPSSRPQRPGAGTIVTGESPDPSQPLQKFNSISGKPQCNCVEYHKCDPNTRTPIDDGNNNGASPAGGRPNTGSISSNTNDLPFDGFGVINIRFNADDPVCEHFLDVCCDSDRTRTVSLMPTPVEERRPTRATGCGIRNVGGVDFNITGDNDNESNFGEFPWTVALLHANNNSYFCTGALIHPSVVLTAVHCIINRPVSGILVRAGEWDSQTTRERLPFQERRAQRIINHPQYNPRNVAWDFGLVILSEPVTLNDHINTICLPNQDEIAVPRTTCYSTGWGKDKFGAEGRFSVIMKRVPLPIVDFNTCQNQLRTTRLTQRFALDPSFLCAGGVRGVDTCQGDGGAPLVCPIGVPSENRYHQSGIVAWGIGCNDNIPAAYANVALARNWIDSQMLGNGFDTSSYTVA